MIDRLRRHNVAHLVMYAWLLGVSGGVAAQQSTAYPELYRAHGLPELPGGSVTSVGRQTSSLRDGLRIRLTSSRPLAEVRDFYRNALMAGGWKEEDTPAARAARTNPRLVVINVVKNRLTCAVTVMTQPNATETQVMINVVER